MATTKPEITETDQALRELLQVQAPEEIVEFINMLVYAEAGTGKTYLAGTADDDERLRPLLMIDVEGGMVTLRERRGIDVVKIRSMAELEAIHGKLYQSIKSDGTMYYKTVCIDSHTELADLDMRLVMKQAYQQKPETVNIDVPSPREYGIVRNHMRVITRGFRDLPCHVVYLAGLGIDQPENMPPKYFPSFSGKLAREIPGFMDIVGYYRAVSDGEGGLTRQLQVQGSNRVVAKDRTKVLGVNGAGSTTLEGSSPGLIVNPTLTSIWDAIEGVALTPKTNEEKVITNKKAD